MLEGVWFLFYKINECWFNRATATKLSNKGNPTCWPITDRNGKVRGTQRTYTKSKDCMAKRHSCDNLLNKVLCALHRPPSGREQKPKGCRIARRPCSAASLGVRIAPSIYGRVVLVTSSDEALYKIRGQQPLANPVCLRRTFVQYGAQNVAIMRPLSSRDVKWLSDHLCQVSSKSTQPFGL